MNRLTSILGLISSWGILLLNVIVTITLFHTGDTFNNSDWHPAVTSYFNIDPPRDFIENISYYAHFMISPLFLVLFASFHDWARHSHKIFSRIALSIIIIAVGLRTLSMILQAPLEQFNINACDDKCLLYETYRLLNSLSSSLYIISITALTGLAELFLAPVFSNKTRTERNLKFVFLLSGILCILSAIPIRTSGNERSGFVIFLSQLFIIVVMIFCLMFFRHNTPEKQVEQ